MSASDSKAEAVVASPGASARGAWLTAAVAGLFVAVVGVRMVVGHVGGRVEDPREAPALASAREQLKARPKDEALKAEIRAMDVALRRAYWGRIERNNLGGWLLLGGLGIGILAGRQAWAMRAPQPLPGPRRAPETDLVRRAGRARWAVAGVGLAVGLGVTLYGWLRPPRLPGTTAELARVLGAGGAGAAADVGPTEAEWSRNWPRFRGPQGDGVVGGTNAPTEWNGVTGTGVLWKAPVGVVGFSSPVVWGDRVFVTGGTAKAREVVCFHAGTGERLWQKAVPAPAGGLPAELEVPEHTGYAASTPATDGRRVFAIFLTGELAAFDFGGGLAWSKFLGVPENMYGHATSLLTWKDLLLVQFDQGEAESGKSRLYALESATGRVRWEQRRAVPSTWTTPVVVRGSGREQLITMSEPWLISYDPATGRELWRAGGLGTDLAPSPILAGEYLVVVSPGRELSAWRMDGSGEVTATHRVWTFDETVPDITSPVSHGDLVFLVSTPGLLVCLEAASGKKVWEKDLELEINASPVRVGDRLYLTTMRGVTVQVAAGREYRELGRCELGDAVFASPAVVDGRWFVRGQTNLFCLGGAR